MPVIDLDTWDWNRDPFPEILTRWLQNLPAEGWEGTIFQLQVALNKISRRYRLYGSVPTQNALGVRIRAEKALIEEQGFEFIPVRTAKQRAIRISSKFVENAG